MELKEKLELVTRGVKEVVEKKELKKLLKEKERPVAYLGYAPTGRLHLGHLFNLSKIADFLDAGFSFKFLVADLHAYLDDKKSPFELLDKRSKYTKEMIIGVMKALNVDYEDLEFVRGSDFQLKEDYTLDVLKMAGNVTFSRTKRAASEVVRFGDHPKLGGFIYPLMQNEDVVKLDADVAYGGIDQRGIYMLGREILPEIGYKKPICVFAPLIPSVSGGKMSASEKKGKIDLLDDEKTLTQKIKGAYCPEGEIKDNGVLVYAKKVLFPLLKRNDMEFLVKRKEKYGGNVSYNDYKDLEKDFVKKDLHPQDLKLSFARNLAKVLKPLRNVFEKEKNKKLLKKAYPEE